jgi:hypothetical protein
LTTDNQNSVVRTAITARHYAWSPFRDWFRQALLAERLRLEPVDLDAKGYAQLGR